MRILSKLLKRNRNQTTNDTLGMQKNLLVDSVCSNKPSDEAAGKLLGRKLYKEINEFGGDVENINLQFRRCQDLKALLEEYPDEELLYDLAFNCRDAAMRTWAIPRIASKISDLDLLEKTADAYCFIQSEHEAKMAYQAVTAQLDRMTATCAERTSDETLLLRIVLMSNGASFETRKKAIGRITNKEMLQEIITKSSPPVGDAAKDRLKGL